MLPVTQASNKQMVCDQCSLLSYLRGAACCGPTAAASAVTAAAGAALITACARLHRRAACCLIAPCCCCSWHSLPTERQAAPPLRLCLLLLLPLLPLCCCYCLLERASGMRGRHVPAARAEAGSPFPQHPRHLMHLMHLRCPRCPCDCQSFLPPAAPPEHPHAWHQRQVPRRVTERGQDVMEQVERRSSEAARYQDSQQVRGLGGRTEGGKG